MKTKYAFIRTSLLAAFFLVSCEKVVYVDLSGNESRLVLNGLITPGYGLWLNVSRSVEATQLPSRSYVPVTNATVDYYRENVLVASIVENTAGNYYENAFMPQPNERYRIVVNTPGLPEASTWVTVPVPVEIQDFDTSTVVRYSQPGTQVNAEVDFFASFSIADPDSVSNYYMLGVYYLDAGEYKPVRAESEDMVVNIYILDGLEVLAWNDRDFNGQTKRFNVSFTMWKTAGFETGVQLILYSIEEEYFKYLKTHAQNFTVLNDDPLLHEAVRVSSNITGGYGIFAAYSTSWVYFDYVF